MGLDRIQGAAVVNLTSTAPPDGTVRIIHQAGATAFAVTAAAEANLTMIRSGGGGSEIPLTDGRAPIGALWGPNVHGGIVLEAGDVIRVRSSEAGNPLTLYVYYLDVREEDIEWLGLLL